MVLLKYSLNSLYIYSNILHHNFSLVEGPDQFSFKRIPYASPVLGRDRWSYSKPKTSIEDCHDGTLIAHSHSNDSTGSCWRKYGGTGGGSGGTEECLNLDIYTSNVVYTPLMPVVVYIDGDELSEEMSEKIRPSAGLLLGLNY